MENNVTVVNKPELVEAKAPANYNKDLGSDVRRIQIRVRRRTTKDGKKKFKSIKGYMYLPIMDGNVMHNPLGRWLDVHFNKEAFDNVPNECDIHKPEDLSTGFLYVRARGVQAPTIYKVIQKLDDKNEPMYDNEGNAVLTYPSIWIKGDIVGFEPYVVSQNAFDYVAPVADAESNNEDDNVDPNTGEILDDEPTEIK